MLIGIFVCALLTGLSFLAGMKIREAEVRLLKSTNSALEERNTKQQQIQTELLNTILLMRRQNMTAPPVEEAWEPYTTDEGDAELEETESWG